MPSRAAVSSSRIRAHGFVRGRTTRIIVIFVRIPTRSGVRKLAQEGNRFAQKRNRANFFVAVELMAASHPAPYLFAKANRGSFPLTTPVVSPRIGTLASKERSDERLLAWLAARAQDAIF